VRFEGVVVVQKVEELTCVCNEGKPSVAIRGHQRQLSSLRRRRDSDSPRAPPRYKGDRVRYKGRYKEGLTAGVPRRLVASSSEIHGRYEPNQPPATTSQLIPPTHLRAKGAVVST